MFFWKLAALLCLKDRLSILLATFVSERAHLNKEVFGKYIQQMCHRR